MTDQDNIDWLVEKYNKLRERLLGGEHMHRILVDIIPHDHQRYDTAGDWFIKGDTLYIHVSEMPDPRYEQLIALHESVEAILCSYAGITEEMVDAWDMAHPESDDPGALIEAPYHTQHMQATAVEELLATELGVDWDAYDRAVSSLVWRKDDGRRTE